MGPDGTMTHMAVMSTLGKCDWSTWPNPAGIYLFKAPIGKTTTMCKICLKLTVRSPERRLSGVFKQISRIVWCFIIGFQQVNAEWERLSGSKMKKSP